MHPKMKPEYLDVAGILVNLIPVRAKPMPTASKLGRAKPAVFTRNDFATQVAYHDRAHPLPTLAIRAPPEAYSPA
jgi:hypothetical protein